MDEFTMTSMNCQGYFVTKIAKHSVSEFEIVVSLIEIIIRRRNLYVTLVYPPWDSKVHSTD
jgi:hypothetical protein